MLLSIVTPKERFCDSGPKSARMCVLRTFAPQNALFRPFRSKTVKTAMGQKRCSSQCFFIYFGCHFRKMAQKGRFSAFWAVLTTFGGQKLLLRPKSEKAQKPAKDEKASFSLRAQNSENIRFWARFWSPKRPKALFPLLGQFFRSGAFWAPKAPQKRKMSSFSLFCSQKWKIRVFAILVEKTCPERYVYKGFCASGESE